MTWWAQWVRERWEAGALGRLELAFILAMWGVVVACFLLVVYLLVWVN